MKIRVLQNTLCGGVWHEPGVGDYDPVTAQHLIDIGVAEAYETKVIEHFEIKDMTGGGVHRGPISEPIDEKKSLSVSPPAQALQKRTYRKSKDRA